MGIIGIALIGGIAEEDLEYLRAQLEARFEHEVFILSPLQEPAFAYHRSRGQSQATRILGKPSAYSSGGYDRVLGIARVDLYATGMKFVFGQADTEAGVAAVSSTRFEPRFYGQREDRTLYLERLLKESVHELGHTFRLGHCSDPSCVMAFSNSIVDTDLKGTEFCSRCYRKLKLRL